MLLTLKPIIVAGLLLLMAGCGSISKHVEYEQVQPGSYPVLSAVGYAPISTQQGTDENSKVLMALKASKLDAYRELTEQVYGQKVDGEQSLRNMVINNSQLMASVQGVIRGARVVKSYPVGDDTYATELELDLKRVYQIYQVNAKPRKVRKVHYY